MRSPSVLALIAALLSGAASAQSVERFETPVNENAPDVPQAMVGKRVLNCHVRRATNIDPSKEQAEADIVYAEAHDFTLELAAGQVPLATGVSTAHPDVAPPAQYRIASDPQQLFQMAGSTLDRVADYWPKHVEVGKTVMGKAFSFVLLDQIAGDPTHMTAFVSRAADAVTIDLTWIHRGQCEIVAPSA